MPKSSRETIQLDGGKYTVTFEDGELWAERNGTTWRELTGDKLILCLFQRIQELEAAAAAALAKELATADWVLVPKVASKKMMEAGGYINSEFLNDNAPIGQSRYEAPMAGVYVAMLAAA